MEVSRARTALPLFSESAGEPADRDTWLRREIAALDAAVEQRCAAILEVLREKALDLQTDFTEAMLRERRTCQPSERGRIGLRVRTATTSAAGCSRASCGKRAASGPLSWIG